MSATEVPVNCPKCKEGVLFDVTSRLAEALGLKQVQCDKCGQKMGAKVAPGLWDDDVVSTKEAA